MNLPRTFVSFSSADIGRYNLMRAWKNNDNIDFNFADFQLDEAINSTDPYYIKSVCRKKIQRADTFVLLIGDDTWTKTEYVQSEVEAAIEKGCLLVGVNLNNCKSKDTWCPDFFSNKGAIFVPFSSKILKEALTLESKISGDYSFKDSFYVNLGYQLVGNKAILPPPPNPFKNGTPHWKK